MRRGWMVEALEAEASTMTEGVQIAVVVCVTVLVAIFLIRSSLDRVVRSSTKDFTFVVTIPFGGGIWLCRGNHAPPHDVAKRFASKLEQAGPATGGAE